MEPQFNFVNNYNVLDLFCGCGGLSKGLEHAGFSITSGIDHWDKAIETYKQNFKHDAICEDLSKLTPKDFDKKYNKGKEIDIIVGGPPCQGFSMAGKRDKNDPRNSLFMEYVKYLDYFKPKIFLFENVLGIMSAKTSKGEKCIDVILECLGKNYNCVLNKLYASDFYVPQNRRRIIIIGIRKDFNIIPEPVIPILSTETRIPVSTVLLDRDKVSKSYFLSQKAIDGINRKKNKMADKNYGFGAQYLSLDKPCYTIPARYWKDGYDALVKYDNNNIRRLTEKELARIQTFPENFKFSGSKKDTIMQIGNAVPCKFAYYLGLFLHEIMDKINTK